MNNKKFFCRQMFNFSVSEKRMTFFAGPEEVDRIDASLDTVKVNNNKTFLDQLAARLITKGGNQLNAVNDMRNAVMAMQAKGKEFVVAPDKNVLIALAAKRNWITKAPTQAELDAEAKSETIKQDIASVLRINLEGPTADPTTKQLVKEAIAKPDKNSIESKKLEFALRALMTTEDTRNEFDALIAKQGSALMLLGHLKLLTSFAPEAKTLSRPPRPFEKVESKTLLKDYGAANKSLREMLEPLLKVQPDLKRRAEFDSLKNTPAFQAAVTSTGQVEGEMPFRSYYLKNLIKDKVGLPDPAAMYKAALQNEKDFYEGNSVEAGPKNLHKIAKEYSALWKDLRFNMQRFFQKTASGYFEMKAGANFNYWQKFMSDKVVSGIFNGLREKESKLLGSGQLPEFMAYTNTITYQNIDQISGNLFRVYKDGVPDGMFKEATPNPFVAGPNARENAERQANAPKGRLQAMRNILGVSRNKVLDAKTKYQVSDTDAKAFIKALQMLKRGLATEPMELDEKEVMEEEMRRLCTEFNALTKRDPSITSTVESIVSGGFASFDTGTPDAAPSYAPSGRIESLETVGNPERLRELIVKTLNLRDPAITRIPEANVRPQEAEAFLEELQKLVPYMQQGEGQRRQVETYAGRFSGLFNVQYPLAKQQFDSRMGAILAQAARRGSSPFQPRTGVAMGGGVDAPVRTQYISTNANNGSDTSTDVNKKNAPKKDVDLSRDETIIRTLATNLTKDLLKTVKWEDGNRFIVNVNEARQLDAKVRQVTRSLTSNQLVQLRNVTLDFTASPLDKPAADTIAMTVAEDMQKKFDEYFARDHVKKILNEKTDSRLKPSLVALRGKPDVWTKIAEIDDKFLFSYSKKENAYIAKPIDGKNQKTIFRLNTSTDKWDDITPGKVEAEKPKLEIIPTNGPNKPYVGPWKAPGQPQPKEVKPVETPKNSISEVEVDGLITKLKEYNAKAHEIFDLSYPFSLDTYASEDSEAKKQILSFDVAKARAWATEAASYQQSVLQRLDISTQLSQTQKNKIVIAKSSFITTSLHDVEQIAFVQKALRLKDASQSSTDPKVWKEEKDHLETFVMPKGLNSKDPKYINFNQAIQKRVNTLAVGIEAQKKAVTFVSQLENAVALTKSIYERIQKIATLDKDQIAELQGDFKKHAALKKFILDGKNNEVKFFKFLFAGEDAKDLLPAFLSKDQKETALKLLESYPKDYEKKLEELSKK